MGYVHLERLSIASAVAFRNICAFKSYFGQFSKNLEFRKSLQRQLAFSGHLPLEYIWFMVRVQSVLLNVGILNALFLTINHWTVWLAVASRRTLLSVPRSTRVLARNMSSRTTPIFYRKHGNNMRSPFN